MFISKFPAIEKKLQMSEKNAGKTGLLVSPLFESVFLFSSIDSGTSDEALFSFTRMELLMN
jgi:hypothetical protein